MTAEKALELALALRPTELDREILHVLLWELEEQLALEIRGEWPCARAVTCTELKIPAPFDRIYWTYLISMIDLSMGHTEAYRISHALYSESKEAYARWHQRTVGKGH